MPVLDTVALFAAADSNDRYNEAARKYLGKLSSSTYWLAALAMVEFDVVLKSRGKSSDDRMEILALLIRDFPSISKKILTLTPEVFFLLARIEKEQGLDYFDAGIAAESLRKDGIVISTDCEFDFVPELKRRW